MLMHLSNVVACIAMPFEGDALSYYVVTSTKLAYWQLCLPHLASVNLILFTRFYEIVIEQEIG